MSFLQTPTVHPLSPAQVAVIRGEAVQIGPMAHLVGDTFTVVEEDDRGRVYELAATADDQFLALQVEEWSEICKACVIDPSEDLKLPHRMPGGWVRVRRITVGRRWRLEITDQLVGQSTLIPAGVRALDWLHLHHTPRAVEEIEEAIANPAPAREDGGIPIGPDAVLDLELNLVVECEDGEEARATHFDHEIAAQQDEWADICGSAGIAPSDCLHIPTRTAWIKGLRLCRITQDRRYRLRLEDLSTGHVTVLDTTVEILRELQAAGALPIALLEIEGRDDAEAAA